MSGLRTAFFVSFAANLLLLGVIGGAVLSNQRHDRIAAQSGVVRAPNMRALMESLPPERARTIREEVVKTWRAAREERRAARAARFEVNRLAGANPYDAEAMKAGFARMRAADGAVAQRFQDTIAGAMDRLTPEERRNMLRILARQRRDRDLRPPIDEVPPTEPARP